MGLVFNRGEIGAFTGDNNVALEEKIGGLEKLLCSHQEFIDTGQLQGAGWSSAKGLFRDVFVPLAKLQVQYAELLMRANSKTASLMDSYLSGYDLLIEDGLEEAIRQARTLEASIKHRLASRALTGVDDRGSNPFRGPLEAQLEGVRMDIELFEQKLERLRAFDAATRNLYDEAKACGQRVESALVAIKGRTWNSGTGRFSTAGINMGWAADIGGYWGKREHSYDKVAWYRAWFGMDRVQAELLAEFDQKFEVYAKEQGWSEQQKQFEKCRLLASIAYDGFEWEMSIGVFKPDALREVFEKLGIAGDNYILFTHTIKTQNLGYDSTGRNILVPHQVGFVHLMGSMACILKVQRDWSEKGSVVYGGLTMGLRNNSWLDFLLQTRTDYAREAATFAGDIASASLPDKDIRADMDAINLTDILAKEPDKPIDQLLSEYYSGVADGKVSRADDFLRHYSRKYFDSDNPQKGYEFLKGHLDDMLETPAVAVLGEGKDPADQKDAREGFLRFLENNKGCYADD